jgi:hypothetical protein
MELLTPTLKKHLKMLKQLDLIMILIISRKNEINKKKILKKKSTFFLLNFKNFGITKKKKIYLIVQTAKKKK